MTEISLSLIVDWLNLFREVCIHAIANSDKLVGTADSPILIVESYFCGKRKYSRGRLLQGDINSRPSYTLRNNYGTLVKVPWVLGLYKSKFDVWFILIPDRRGATLLPIIQDHVSPGSTINTDEWGGYNGLAEARFSYVVVISIQSRQFLAFFLKNISLSSEPLPYLMVTRRNLSQDERTVAYRDLLANTLDTNRVQLLP